MAYNFKAEGKSNEETLRLTTHYMTRAQRSVNCNRVLTPEEQMKSMTAPTAKKVSPASRMILEIVPGRGRQNKK
jgi:hypothetical protein